MYTKVRIENEKLKLEYTKERLEKATGQLKTRMLVEMFLEKAFKDFIKNKEDKYV